MNARAADQSDVDTRVVVVGAGPRGVSIVERLVARGADAGRPVTVVLADPYLPVGGRVWRTDQPGELLMNTMVGDNTVFPDASVRLGSPVGTGPTFAEWATALSGRDYAPRAEYGRYLHDALARVTRAAPGQLRIECRAVEVVRIAETRAGYSVAFADGDRLHAAAVVLATGHLDTPAPSRWPGHTGAGHPADYPLDEIGAGADVLLRGAGLNAFDVIARLTLGRGGTFDERGAYVPSGREPRIWITSRRGVPFHARVDAPGYTPPVAFLTPARVDTLRSATRVDFARDVLPHLVADLELAWYSRVDEQDAARFRLDLPTLLDPLAGKEFASLAELRSWWGDHLDADYASATATEPTPLAALIAAVRHARVAVRRIVMAGNLTGESYRRDVLGAFNGWANFLSGGPPALRVRQLRGLLAAGIVDLLGPLAALDGDPLTAESAVVPGLRIRPDHVVDAWLPPVDVTTPGPGLVRRLIAGGLARPHRLPPATPSHAPVPTGALDARVTDGRVRRPDGAVHSGLFAAGIPLEGVRWTTAIGARPGTDSDFFHETDAIAAAIVDIVAACRETA